MCFSKLKVVQDLVVHDVRLKYFLALRQHPCQCRVHDFLSVACVLCPFQSLVQV